MALPPFFMDAIRMFLNQKNDEVIWLPFFGVNLQIVHKVKYMVLTWNIEQIRYNFTCQDYKKTKQNIS